MNRIQAAIKCPNCSKVLSTPVVLPCGHSICQEHTNVDQDTILCQKCGKSHRNRDLMVNESLMEMITAQIGSIDFGTVHLNATKSCDRLNEALATVETLLGDLDGFIDESVANLKNRVYLKSDKS